MSETTCGDVHRTIDETWTCSRVAGHDGWHHVEPVVGPTPDLCVCGKVWANAASAALPLTTAELDAIKARANAATPLPDTGHPQACGCAKCAAVWARAGGLAHAARGVAADVQRLVDEVRRLRRDAVAIAPFVVAADAVAKRAAEQGDRLAQVAMMCDAGAKAHDRVGDIESAALLRADAVACRAGALRLWIPREACAYCGTGSSDNAEMRVHIETCEKHPMAKLRAELDRLRDLVDGGGHA